MIEKEQILELFYWFHRHPELSYEEFGTTEKIREILTQAGVEVLPLPLETGLVAQVTGEQEGETAALRCDIDGLPVTEESGLFYSSEYPGKMHACGHDFHIMAGIVATLFLQENRERLKGSVKIFFQPAEESAIGAKKILETGEMDGVWKIWGLHADPTNPVGTIGLRQGYVAASVDRFVVTVEGIGCHGAHPDDGVDPIPAAAAMVQAFQTIVSRNINPFHPALISVTRIEAGKTWNVIPQTAEIEGTVRTMDRADRELFKKRLFEIADRTAAAYGAQARVQWMPGSPAVYNDGEMVHEAIRKAKECGYEVVPQEQSLGGDDFSFYTENVPGCYIKIGTGVGPTIHQPKFAVDPEAIVPAGEFLAKLMLD